MRASVPTSTVDNSYENFPKGMYDGNIGSAEIRDVNGDGSWLTLKLGIESINAQEGTNDPGRTAFQSDITIVTDGVDLREVEDFSNGKVPFQLVRAAGLLAGLAEGLGVSSRENGVVEVDIEAVAAALTSGEFAGDRVGFEVSHYTNKATPPKTYDQFNRFGPAS